MLGCADAWEPDARLSSPPIQTQEVQLGRLEGSMCFEAERKFKEYESLTVAWGPAARFSSSSIEIYEIVQMGNVLKEKFLWHKEVWAWWG